MPPMRRSEDQARARYGWESDFPTFAGEEPRGAISLEEFLKGS